MPIHVRAEPGEYAEACLLPGDPLRAKYIAETYLDDAVQRNSERGLLGYTGTYEGKPVSVQGTGMGCPGATIVFEELDPARRQEAAARRHLRRPPAAPRARRPDRRALRGSRRLDRDAPRRQRAALPDRELGADPRRGARGEGDRPGDARRPDRLERRLLQPGRGPVRALVEARRARRRDGGRGALHRRRAPRRPVRLPADRQRHRRRGRVQADHRRRAAGGRRPDDARRARHGDHGH